MLDIDCRIFGRLFQIKSQVGFAMFFVWTMALQAVLSKNRLDPTAIADRFFRHNDERNSRQKTMRDGYPNDQFAKLSLHRSFRWTRAMVVVHTEPLCGGIDEVSPKTIRMLNYTYVTALKSTA